METYIIHVDVLEAEGFQTWAVKAKSKMDALKKYSIGDGEIVNHEIEPILLSDPCIEDVKKI